jgi:hypothetical protein
LRSVIDKPARCSNAPTHVANPRSDQGSGRAVVNQSVWYVLSDKRHAKCLADFESKIRSALKRSGKVAQSTDPGHNRPGTTHRVREHKQAKYGLRQRRQRQKLPNNFFSAQIPVSSGQNPISVTASSVTVTLAPRAGQSLFPPEGQRPCPTMPMETRLPIQAIPTP